MAKTLAAVIGVGQTHYRAKREDVSMPGLLREAIDRALEDAGMTLADIGRTYGISRQLVSRLVNEPDPNRAN